MTGFLLILWWDLIVVMTMDRSKIPTFWEQKFLAGAIYTLAY